MGSELRFDGKVVVITGAGQGLGRSHALMFAQRGAKVVVNDLGGTHTGTGKSSAAADKVCAEIKALGGTAVPNYDSVEDGDQIIKTAIDAFGRVDIIVNNAGILRDTSFQKMTREDWDLIFKVHVLGAFRVTHAAWPYLRDQSYGRIIFTTSAAGLYGNFGQANYSAAKLALVGLAQTLALEGEKRNIHANAIAPIAGSRMTETVLPKDVVEALKPEYVSPLVGWLCHEECQDNGGVYEVGGGFMAKLHWERAEGKTFKLGKEISPDAVKAAWEAITDFGRFTHPASVTESMQPVLANLNSKSKGGNELIDVDQALGFELPGLESSYDERDLAIYALGVGAGRNPTDEKELHLVYERNQEGFWPLPTYGVIPALNAIFKLAAEGKTAPGLNYGLDRILHGEQYTELLRPLPTSAQLVHKAKISEIWDKGKNAVVVTHVDTHDKATGELLVKNDITMVVRGAGGWGGERGPSSDVNVPPDRAPDAVVTEKTSESQALLYRLSGDWNPLHVDPEFATAFGFDRPILHGLCTFGYVARAVVNSFLGGDPRRFKSIKVRFAESVFPGETIKTEMWKESANRVVVRATVVERNKVIITNAAVDLYEKIPERAAAPQAKAEAKPAAAQPAVAAQPAASGELTSAATFQAIGSYVAKHPELVGQVKCLYQFNLKSPESHWIVDLKNGAGSVAQGTTKAECTLELSDADWMAMVGGKADPNKLFMTGKLKISGNIMASQKLTFLTKIDKAELEAAAKSAPAAAASAPAPAPAAAPAASGELTSAATFQAIGSYVAKHPELAGQIKCLYQFNLKSPESHWVVDLKNGGGSVAAGTAKADCTLELTEADWMAMVGGKADPNKLFMTGKLKISGNIMASQKLTFLTKIDKAELEAAAKSAPAAAASAPAAGAAGGGAANAPKILAALKERLAKSPALGNELGGVVQFKVKEPELAFWVDGRQPFAGEGLAPKPDTTVTIKDEDLTALAKGEATPYFLFMHGLMRVDGDVGPAQRLGLFKQLL